MTSKESLNPSSQYPSTLSAALLIGILVLYAAVASGLHRCVLFLHFDSLWGDVLAIQDRDVESSRA